MDEAALQAGNSETIIRCHYLDLKTLAGAEAFFGIMSQVRPIPAVERNVITMPRPPPLATTG